MSATQAVITVTTVTTSTTLTWVDYLIIGIIAFSVFISLIRGFVRETFSLLTWVAAFLIAFNFGSTLGDVFKDHIASQTARLALGAGLLFITTLIVGAIVNYLLATLVDKTGLTGTDRVLGLVLGGARGVLIVSVLILVMNYTAIPKDEAWKQSLLLPHFEGCAKWVQSFIPQALDFVSGQ